jgi:hypothetical protein
MKSTEEILQYIEEFYANATERPQSYFGGLLCMESELMTLEYLRDFILEKERTYPQFLGEEDYGSFGFCGGKYEEDKPYDMTYYLQPSDQEITKMKELGEFWRKYLKSEQRAAQ